MFHERPMFLEGRVTVPVSCASPHMPSRSPPRRPGPAFLLGRHSSRLQLPRYRKRTATLASTGWRPHVCNTDPHPHRGHEQPDNDSSPHGTRPAPICTSLAAPPSLLRSVCGPSHTAPCHEAAQRTRRARVSSTTRSRPTRSNITGNAPWPLRSRNLTSRVSCPMHRFVRITWTTHHAARSHNGAGLAAAHLG
jgi:hypothetical protein